MKSPSQAESYECGSSFFFLRIEEIEDIEEIEGIERIEGNAWALTC